MWRASQYTKFVSVLRPPQLLLKKNFVSVVPNGGNSLKQVCYVQE